MAKSRHFGGGNGGACQFAAMLNLTDIVGRRLVEILGDSSQADESRSHCDFLYGVEHGLYFRLPWEVGSDDWITDVRPASGHGPVDWPRRKWWHYRTKLWAASIVDILVPLEPEYRSPDSGVIALSSGWYVVQCSGGPTGIMPYVDIVSKVRDVDSMVPVWDT